VAVPLSAGASYIPFAILHYEICQIEGYFDVFPHRISSYRVPPKSLGCSHCGIGPSTALGNLGFAFQVILPRNAFFNAFLGGKTEIIFRDNLPLVL
jgi:hypothetical protein